MNASAAEAASGGGGWDEVRAGGKESLRVVVESCRMSVLTQLSLAWLLALIGQSKLRRSLCWPSCSVMCTASVLLLISLSIMCLIYLCLQVRHGLLLC